MHIEIPPEFNDTPFPNRTLLSSLYYCVWRLREPRVLCDDTVFVPELPAVNAIQLDDKNNASVAECAVPQVSDTVGIADLVPGLPAVDSALNDI